MSRAAGLYSAFDEVCLVDALRTPWVDLGGALAQVSPIDLGIAVARGLFARSGIEAAAVDSVIAGSMAQASFDAYFLPRHIGLYSGVPQAVPALAVQRICGTGFEILRQAGEQIARGSAALALCVASESMSRNPIAAYTHRGGFRLGAPVEFKDFLWEALFDPAAGIDMLQTAENLARIHGLERETVDRFAARSFARALAAEEAGWFAGEILPLERARFALDGGRERALELPRGSATAMCVPPRSRPCSACVRYMPAACRPPATAARWWTARPPRWSAPAATSRAPARWPGCAQPAPAGWPPNGWASARWRRSACCSNAAP